MRYVVNRNESKDFRGKAFESTIIPQREEELERVPKRERAKLALHIQREKGGDMV